MLGSRRTLVQTLYRRSAACFSSSATSVSDEKRKYAQQRSVYKSQLTELRKEWTKDHEDKVKAEDELKKQKKDQVVLETAIRLRAKRIKKLNNSGTDKRFKDAALAEYRAKLAKHIVLDNLEHQRAEKRFKQLVADLVEESSTWITMENMDERIVPALFDSPFATTGLVTKHSDYNRYYTHPDCYKRLVAETRAQGGIDEFGNVMPDERWKFALNHSDVDESWDSRQAEILQHRSDERLTMERNLNTLVGTAEEREKYADLVRQFIEQTHTDEQAIVLGRQDRQARLMEQEEERDGKIDDMIAIAHQSGDSVDNLSHLSLDQERSKLVDRFKQDYPSLPGTLGPAYSAMRKRIDRLCCQEDFDQFLTTYVEFTEQLKSEPDVEATEFVSDIELITNADYLDRIAERLHEMRERAEFMSDIPMNMQHLYTDRLQTYRQDWWKLQGLLVLAGRADECSLCDEFPETVDFDGQDV